MIFISLLLLYSCSIETYTTRKNAADQAVLKYIYDNGLHVEADSLGFAFINMIEGEGDCPREGDKVAFHYKGYFFDGEIFDTSYGKPYPLIVELGDGMLIKGLEESLKLMSKGSKAKVVVPFYLAYDDLDNAPVPPYSNLIFEIELIDFTSVKK